MKEDHKFKCLNNFYVRFPLLSYDQYLNFSNETLDDVLKNAKDKYLEPILVSSRELYNSIINDIPSKNKDEAVYKYMMRNSTRTTPYGLCSGVCRGRFVEDGNSCVLKQDNKKSVRVDMEWLVEVIKRLEVEMGLHLRLKVSNLIIKRNPYIFKLYNSSYMIDVDKKELNTRINSTKLVDTIFLLAKEYITIEHLMIELNKLNENYTADKVYPIINEMFKSEFLMSDLRVSTAENDALKTLIMKLEKYYSFKEDDIEQLRHLDDKIKKYSDINIGNGEKRYIGIIVEMEKIQKAKNYLHVDMYNNSMITLDQSLKKDLNMFIDFLSKWVCYDTYDNYIMKFKEKYGEQCVKATDLFDEEYGLGFPEKDGNNSKKYYDNLKAKFISLILNSEKNIINLIDLYDDNLFSIDDKRNPFPYSCEFSFFVFKNNENYILQLSPMIGSEKKEKALGRFKYLFEHEGTISECMLHNKKVELVCVPQLSRDMNVMHCNSNATSILEVGTYSDDDGREKINLEDIYVYVDKESKLQFIHKNTGVQLHFELSNKYNFNRLPKMIKTLLEITNNQRPAIESLIFALNDILKNVEGYIPRIVIGDIILLAESYRIPVDVMNKIKLQFDDFVQYIRDELITNLNFIRVLVGPVDHKLVLNLEDNKDLLILYKMIKKDNTLLISKWLFEKDCLVLEDTNRKKYVGEFVFQFEQENSNFQDKSDYSPIRIPYIDFNAIQNNTHYSFREWITIKIYVRSETIDLLLCNIVYDLVKNMLFDKNIKEFHYLRYKDPLTHIRLRLKVSDGEYEKVLLKIKELENILYEKKLISSIAFDSYIPEISRYGGENCIEKAEKLFCINSIQAIRIINGIKQKIINFNLDDAFIISSYKMLIDMGLSDEEIERYLSRYKLEDINKDDFKKTKKRLDGYFVRQDINYNLRKNGNNMNFLIILDSNRQAYSDYWKSICEKYPELSEDQYIVRRYAVVSILHMYFNRLIGIDKLREQKLISFLRKMIYIENEKRIHYEK